MALVLLQVEQVRVLVSVVRLDANELLSFILAPPLRMQGRRFARLDRVSSALNARPQLGEVRVRLARLLEVLRLDLLLLEVGHTNLTLTRRSSTGV